MAKKRRMSAKQRKYFGKKSASSSRRSYKTVATKRRKSSNKLSSWIPLSTEEMLLDAGIGAVVGPLSNWLAPYQQQWFGWAGQFSDEAILATAGALTYKFGSGLISRGGKELFRVAVINSGAQLGSGIFNGTRSGSPKSGMMLG